ncbi:MAG: hypothetical protein ACRD9S_14680 [Pyrinomonadaceae bacterium]
MLLLFLLASLPIRVLVPLPTLRVGVLLLLLAALQFQLPLLFRALLFFTAATGVGASFTLTILLPALLLHGALLILILPNALLVLFPPTSLFFLILIYALAILLPSLLLLRALLLLLSGALLCSLLLLGLALLLRLIVLLLSRGAPLFLFRLALRSTILISLIGLI